MAGALKRVVMSNIQSHIHTVLEFPETGIVRFLGDNSNGKSVMVKVLQDVVSNNISRPAARRSIIRRGNTFGELLLESYSGDTLYVHIDLEASQTYAELTRSGSPTVRRYLADKAIPVLVREFGWHYDDKSGVSINIHNDTDGLLFVDTRKTTNFELLSSMRSDAFAEAALLELTRLVKETKQKRDEMFHTYEVAEATYLALKTWDKDQESQVRDECLYYAGLLENLTMPSIPEFRLQRSPTFVQPIPNPPVFQIPHIYPPMPALPAPATETLHDMVELLSGNCPTCGRPFIEGGHSHEMV